MLIIYFIISLPFLAFWIDLYIPKNDYEKPFLIEFFPDKPFNKKLKILTISSAVMSLPLLYIVWPIALVVFSLTFYAYKTKQEGK
jgi:hypothetical protein